MGVNALHADPVDAVLRHPARIAEILRETRANRQRAEPVNPSPRRAFNRRQQTGEGPMAMELHRGRLVDHIQLVVADLNASRRFYDAVFAVLEIPLGGGTEQHFWYDEFFVSLPDGPEAAGELTGRHHLAFQARDRATVDAFYEAGLAAGGRDHGKPGERPQYH